MEEIFLKHKEWIDSQGQKGTQLFLDEKDMAYANIDGKILYAAKILECDFSNKRISKTEFGNSVMCSSIFNFCIINECNFGKSDLNYTSFKGAIISNSSFSRTDFIEADFKNAIITNSKFIDACLYLTNFSNVKFENIDFSGAVFEETVLLGAEFNNLFHMEEAVIKSINIGTIDNPNIIFGDEAKTWIYDKMKFD